jgi:hypothetical protein
MKMRSMNSTKCPECGESPMGTGCYHICPNSVYFYTPEQERYDDQFYGMDDDRERYAATIEPSQYWDEGDDEEIEAQPAPSLAATLAEDDLPF